MEGGGREREQAWNKSKKAVWLEQSKTNWFIQLKLLNPQHRTDNLQIKTLSDFPQLMKEAGNKPQLHHSKPGFSQIISCLLHL